MGFRAIHCYATLLLAHCGLFTAQVSASSSLKICHEANQYPPYIFQENAQSRGLLIDIVQKASQLSNIPVTFYGTSWTRCQKDVKAGKAHALFAMVQTTQRTKNFAFPPSEKSQLWYLWQAQYPIFVNANSEINLKTYQPHHGIGAPLNYVVWQILQEKKWLSPFQYGPVDGLNMVALGRLDGYAVERLIGLNLLEQNKLSTKVRVTDTSLLDTYWYIPFNFNYYQENKHQVEQFWSAIAKARSIYGGKSAQTIH